MSLLPVHARPLKMKGPQGIATSIFGKSTITANIVINGGTGINSLLGWPFDNTTIDSQMDDHDTTPDLSRIIVGTNQPLEYVGPVHNTTEFDGLDTLIGLWPNFRVNAMKVTFHITLGEVDFPTKGRYIFAYRWLREDDIIPATISQAEIKEDPSWERKMLWPLEGTETIGGRQSSNVTGFTFKCFAKWKWAYPFETDDAWTQKRIDPVKDTPLTHDSRPVKPLILQWNVFNTHGAVNWANPNAAHVDLKVKIYYQLDRFTGVNSFLE